MITILLGIGLTVIIGLLKFAGLIKAGPSLIWLPLTLAVLFEICLGICGWVNDFRRK
jgi:hypothetical protein